jgi:chemotaxis protein MotB
MRTRKSKPEEHVDQHRWIVSYADFITLLFAFFVVMYAISSVNISKYKSLSDGMKSAFSKKDLNKSTSSSEENLDGPGPKQTKGTFQDGLDDLNKSLSALESKNFQINRQKGWIELDIKAGSLFNSGTADLTSEASIQLMQIAENLKNVPFPIIVEGYTDNLPIETPNFPSNWELSATRAASVARVLNIYGIATDRLLVTGYGEQYPIADNASEAGRGQNRRVNIIIAKDRNSDRIMNPVLDQFHNMIFKTEPVLESKIEGVKQDTKPGAKQDAKPSAKQEAKPSVKQEIKQDSVKKEKK